MGKWGSQVASVTIPADAAARLSQPWLLLPQLRKHWCVCAGVTPNVTQARLSAKALSALQYERAFCTHDSANGVSRPELQRWAELL